MSLLRSKFIRELPLRGRAERTIHVYVASCPKLAEEAWQRPQPKRAGKGLRAAVGQLLFG